jgi:hypothetical protein
MMRESSNPPVSDAQSPDAGRSYRCYFIDADDHIRSYEQVECETDAQAALRAEILLAASQLTTAELWCGTRLVGRWSKAGAAKAELRANADGST